MYTTTPLINKFIQTTRDANTQFQWKIIYFYGFIQIILTILVLFDFRKVLSRSNTYIDVDDRKKNISSDFSWNL